MRPNFMTAVSRLMARAVVSGMLCIAAIANAAETNGPTAWTGVLAGNTATVNEPSALTVTVNTTSVATRSLITVGDSGSPITPVSQPLNSRGATAAMFGVQDTADADSLLDSPSPLAVATTQAVNFVAQVLASCPIASPSGSTCTNMGTITVTFSRPVRNPILHLSGIGGSNDAGGLFGSDIARLNVRLTLASSLPAGASLGVRSAGATNLVPAGNTIETANVDASVSCATTDDSAPGTAAALAGCGSVQVNGTVTSLTFNVEMKYRVVACTGFLCTPTSVSVSGSADAFNLTVSLPQDFSDAPASYGVPRHVIGDLRIGSAIDADRTNTENPTTSSFAATSPNDAIGDDSEASGADDVEPGDDEDGVSFGTLTVGMAGSSYSTTVALSGASQAGEVCGWVDFNRSGAFDVSERVCASFAAGATSAVLTWTVPAGITAGATYARVRAAYGAAGGGASSPTGAANSGEVEDYRIMIVNPQIRVAKITQGSAGGPFAFSTTNTLSQPAALTTAAANVAQTGSPVSIVSLSSDVVVTETALPAGWTLTAISCTQAGGAAVVGAVYELATRRATIPSGSLSGTSDITCTYTNTQQGSITIVKDAVPNDAQDFAFTTTGTGLSAFSLDDDADATLSNTRTFSSLVPGSYSVTETALPGWTLSNLVCVDPDSGSAVNVGTRVATIDLDAGENITCTYTNAKQPILRLQKQLPNGRFVATDQFTLSITGTGAPAPVTTTGAGTTATGTVTVNPTTLGATYTFTEAGAAGANLANYATTYGCTNTSGGQAPSGNGTSFSITPVAGDDITCTFVNVRNPLSDLSITKTNTPGTNGEVDQSGDTVTRGTTTPYTIVVTNDGPDAVTGATVRDPAQTGLVCNDPVPCTGAGCPAATVPLSDLQGGVVLGTVASGATVTFTLSCTVQ